LLGCIANTLLGFFGIHSTSGIQGVQHCILNTVTLCDECWARMMHEVLLMLYFVLCIKVSAFNGQSTKNNGQYLALFPYIFWGTGSRVSLFTWTTGMDYWTGLLDSPKLQ